MVGRVYENDHPPTTSQFDTVCQAQGRQLILKLPPTDLGTSPTVVAVEVWLAGPGRPCQGWQTVAVWRHVVPLPGTVLVVVVTSVGIERLRLRPHDVDHRELWSPGERVHLAPGVGRRMTSPDCILVAECVAAAVVVVGCRPDQQAEAFFARLDRAFVAR